jgi:hypothetical protein
LTLEKLSAKSNGNVLHLASNRYAQWRLRHGATSALREDARTPAERLLQLVWFHQRLRRDRLVTSDGKRLRVLHPGFWNREAGPDFRGAVLQFEGEAPRSGDVEVDLYSSGWRAHRHDRNAAYARVALHVVWKDDGAPQLATLALEPFLDSPLEELVTWLGGEAGETFPLALAGQCSAPLRDLTPAQVMELLHQAALVRLQAKAAQFKSRAREAGWEQALWEGLFRALGYKQNVWPMQRLGELRERFLPAKSHPGLVELQARLLGVAGLLPVELTRNERSADQYLRQVWDYWWRERESVGECQFPRALWRFQGLRPANHPQRRLALAAHWLSANELPGRLERWCQTELAGPALPASLLDLLQAARDEYWSWHWTLRSKRLPKPQPLLGVARVTDLSVNVVLPWLWVRAAEGKNLALQQELERRYLTWPSAEDNAVLRLARQRLFCGPARGKVRGAAAQQGLLQIVRDFCEHSNALCASCQFPELVRQWPRPGGG